MNHEPSELSRQALRRKALLLVWVGELWNIVEAGVALWSGFNAGSIALLAFGLDSLIELFAGLVLIWRLGGEWDEAAEEDAERKAHRLVGISFFVLAAYVLVHSVSTLLGLFPEPRESVVGMVLVVASAGVMTFLFFRKRDLATRLGSAALHAEAKQSLVCDLQDLTILIGLGFNAILGWWWTDPLAALALLPFIVREGWEGVFGEER